MILDVGIPLDIFHHLILVFISLLYFVAKQIIQTQSKFSLNT